MNKILSPSDRPIPLTTVSIIYLWINRHTKIYLSIWLFINLVKMGAVGLEPTRPYKGQRIFILPQLSLLPIGVENWTLSLPSALR
ncbi:MAG TPA: hypothetical protein DCQ51_20535 [Planktothrix sp. UBA8407]|jgi:hypothetical protein|nr:hypothetical protein [Planktothrix sp. UBA8402]HAO13485.1 hypothetical protein [Planktothrix sp. UBA8407]